MFSIQDRLHDLKRIPRHHWQQSVSLAPTSRLYLSNKDSSPRRWELLLSQVLLRSKEAGTMETVDHFLSVCEMMANLKGEYKFCPGIDPCEYETKYFSKIRYDVKKTYAVLTPHLKGLTLVIACCFTS